MAKVSKQPDLSMKISEKLEIRYVPLKTAFSLLWDKNSKLHAIDALMLSFRDYGFRDPPSFDSTLGAIVEGNGRIETLMRMYEEGLPAPNLIGIEDKTNEWCVPIIFGGDAASKEMAMKYAIDHNALSLMGGDFSGSDVTFKLNDPEKLREVLSLLSAADDMPITIDQDDFESFERALLNGGIFEDDLSASENALADQPPPPSRGNEGLSGGRIHPDLLPDILVYELIKEHDEVSKILAKLQALARQIEELKDGSVLEDAEEFDAMKVLEYVTADCQKFQKTLLEYSSVKSYKVKGG